MFRIGAEEGRLVTSVLSGAMRLVVCLTLCGFAVAGCGGGGGGRLSRAAYRSRLATISKHADSAHAAVEGGAPKAKKVSQVAALQRLRHAKGGQEQDEAIAKLKKLGYTTGS